MNEELCRIAANLEQVAKTIQLHARIIENNGDRGGKLGKAREAYILKSIAAAHRELERMFK